VTHVQARESRPVTHVQAREGRPVTHGARKRRWAPQTTRGSPKRRTISSVNEAELQSFEGK